MIGSLGGLRHPPAAELQHDTKTHSRSESGLMHPLQSTTTREQYQLIFYSTAALRSSSGQPLARSLLGAPYAERAGLPAASSCADAPDVEVPGGPTSESSSRCKGRKGERYLTKDRCHVSTPGPRPRSPGE